MNTQVPVKSKENIDSLKHDLEDEAMKELKIGQKRAKKIKCRLETMMEIKSPLTVNSSSLRMVNKQIEPYGDITPTKKLTIVSAKETEQNKHRFSKHQEYQLICLFL